MMSAMRVKLKWFLLSIVVLMALGFSLSSIAKLKPVVIRFGVLAFDRPSKTVLKYRPFLDLIEKALKKTIERPVQIRMMVSRNVEENIYRLTKGKVDVTQMDPAFYVDALKKNSLLKILAAEKIGDLTRQNMVFAVKKESAIQSLQDLKGKKVAFGHKASTCGRLIPQKELLWQGVKGNDLASFDYVGRFENVSGDLLDGKYDAGVLPASYMEQENNLTILAEFSCPTNLWVLDSEFPEDVESDLRNILFKAGSDLDGMKVMGVTGFGMPSAKDILEVEESMVINWTGF